jgi:hypothetical protein
MIENDVEPATQLLNAWLAAFPWPRTSSEVLSILLTTPDSADPHRAIIRSALDTLCRTSSSRPPTSRRIGCILRHLRRRRFGDLYLDHPGERAGAGRRWMVFKIPAGEAGNGFHWQSPSPPPTLAAEGGKTGAPYGQHL